MFGLIYMKPANVIEKGNEQGPEFLDLNSFVYCLVFNMEKSAL